MLFSQTEVGVRQQATAIVLMLLFIMLTNTAVQNQQGCYSYACEYYYLFIPVSAGAEVSVCHSR